MLIIGNGESRRDINLDLIREPKIGCNAIHRDYHTDHLVCVDKRMFKESLDASANLDRLVYTRKEHYDQFKQKRTRIVPDLPYAGSERYDDPFHWGSGPYAVLLGAKIQKQGYVKLLGFDLYGTNGKQNNVYKDTSNYNDSNKREIDPSYWIYQIEKVFECFPHINFIIYQNDGWQMPKSWKKTNVTVDKITSL